MSIKSPPVERRRKAESVRQDALAAGRRLLVEGGPRAITLKAVGAELGMTHANLIHHFGSAEAYQAQLKDLMVKDLTREITSVVGGPERQPRGVGATIDKVFDAYGTGGIAILMAWSSLTGAPRDAEGLATAVRELVAKLAPRLDGPNATGRAGEIVALVTLLAFADGLIGMNVAEAVGAERDAVRRLTAVLIENLMSRKDDG